MTTATAAELQAVLGIKGSTLRMAVKRGHVRKVGRWHYQLTDVMEYLDARRGGPPMPTVGDHLRQRPTSCDDPGTRSLPGSG